MDSSRALSTGRAAAFSAEKSSRNVSRPASATNLTGMKPHGRSGSMGNVRPQTAAHSSFGRSQSTNQIRPATAAQSRPFGQPQVFGSTMTLNTRQNSTIGIQGYYCPKAGPRTDHPKYTIPKDQGQDFLSKVRKHSAKIPAPNKYQKPMKWGTDEGKFRKDARLTMTEEVIKFQKKYKIPSSASYDLSAKFYKVPNGKVGRDEGTDFLSEIKYLGTLFKAGPTTYKNADAKDKTMLRSPGWKIYKPVKEVDEGVPLNTGWKAKKDKSKPDLGTYQHHESKDKTLGVQPKWTLPKSKSLKFTTEYAKNKGSVPAPNKYKLEKVLDHVSRPYMRKR